MTSAQLVWRGERTSHTASAFSFDFLFLLTDRYSATQHGPTFVLQVCSAFTALWSSEVLQDRSPELARRLGFDRSTRNKSTFCLGRMHGRKWGKIDQSPDIVNSGREFRVVLVENSPTQRSNPDQREASGWTKFQRLPKRKKKPCKKFRDAFGHTPLSVDEELP